MRYPVSIDAHAMKDELTETQIVFHGINKSGSLAMSQVLRDGYLHAQREPEFVSHYHTGGSTESFLERVNKTSGRSFVVGHYLFGALKPIPNRIWITQFRHPLPRIVSCHQWLKTKHESRGNGPYKTLSDFVVDSRGVLHSQVVQLGAAHGANRKYRKLHLNARDMLAISIDAIDAHFDFIGIAEHFEESIFAFASLCGLRTVSPWKQDNRNKGRKLVSDLSNDEIELIEEHYSCDFELYSYALEKFRAQNQRLGLNQEHLTTYQAACQSQYKDRILL